MGLLRGRWGTFCLLFEVNRTILGHGHVTTHRQTEPQTDRQTDRQTDGQSQVGRSTYLAIEMSNGCLLTFNFLTFNC